MRRRIVLVAMFVALSLSAGAAPRDNVDRERGRQKSVVHLVKMILRALGDGLTVPLP